MIEHLDGREIESDVRYSQVYDATHDGEGNRLPHRYRSFISFTYGGKYIEDFGIISVIEGDRITRNAYANFEDLTSTYAVVDGQFYWGTHFTNNQISFSLATDGMTQNQLDDFKHWFQPGKMRELILAEHPNRAIMARVDAPPVYSLLPFEHNATIVIEEEVYTIQTTLYKGSIQLSFTMDDPYWYGIDKYITHEQLFGNGIEPDKDALKVMLEDGIPYEHALMEGCLLGGNNYVIEGKPRVSHSGDNPGYVTGVVNGVVSDPTAEELLQLGDDVRIARLGVLMGTVKPSLGNGLDGLYLYYCGTAPATNILSFTLVPIFDDSTNKIIAPYNTLSPISGRNPYNCIKLTFNNKVTNFKFTTPAIYTAYNQALDIVANTNTTSCIDLRNALSEGVKEYNARAWALYVFNNIVVNSINITAEQKATFKTNMQNLFLDSNNTILPARFEFNSKTGQALGYFKFRTPELAMVGGNTSPVIANEEQQNVGDMVCSDYLIIRERNLYSPTDAQIYIDTCTKIETDYPENLTDFSLNYQNLYL